jgi:hypothetical protein
MPIPRSPNGTGHTRPQPGRDRPGMGGRDQSERPVAINWNRWSQSAGTHTLNDRLILTTSARPPSRRSTLDQIRSGEIGLPKVSGWRQGAKSPLRAFGSSVTLGAFAARWL